MFTKDRGIRGGSRRGKWTIPCRSEILFDEKFDDSGRSFSIRGLHFALKIPIKGIGLGCCRKTEAKVAIDNQVKTSCLFLDQKNGKTRVPRNVYDHKKYGIFASKKVKVALNASANRRGIIIARHQTQQIPYTWTPRNNCKKCQPCAKRISHEGRLACSLEVINPEIKGPVDKNSFCG